jgi:hypothetical protein
MAIPPLGVLVLIGVYVWMFLKPGSKKEKIHFSKVTYPPCRPFKYEIDQDGMTWAKPYRDRRGRVRYCCNPNHNHYYG